MPSPKDEFHLSEEAARVLPEAAARCLKRLQDGDKKAKYLGTQDDIGDAFAANDDGRQMKQKTLVIGQNYQRVHDKYVNVIEEIASAMVADFRKKAELDAESGKAIEKTQDGIPGGR